MTVAGIGQVPVDEPGQLGITKALKTMFVRAIREGLGSQLLRDVDPVLSKVGNRVSLEYPVEEVNYPAIWVTTSFTSLNWLSLNSELVHPDGYKYNVGEFNATVTMEAIALSNGERDALVDALVNMVMFGSLESDSDRFYQYLAREPYVELTPLLGEVKLSQDGVNIGTPWSPTQIAYNRNVSFNVYGTFGQRLDNRQLIPLRAIEWEAVDRLKNPIGDGRIDTPSPQHPEIVTESPSDGFVDYRW